MVYYPTSSLLDVCHTTFLVTVLNVMNEVSRPGKKEDTDIEYTISSVVQDYESSVNSKMD